MTEPKPVYVFQAPGAEPRITAQFPYDPSLRILADDLRVVCGYSGATDIAILRGIVAPTLEWNHDGRHASLNLADAGTLILIRFPGHDGGPPAEHFNLAPVRDLATRVLAEVPDIGPRTLARICNCAPATAQAIIAAWRAEQSTTTQSV